ncbi:MAG: hypothetical protein R3C49_13235 [Planctomycetaceae bacterium]
MNSVQKFNEVVPQTIQGAAWKRDDELFVSVGLTLRTTTGGRISGSRFDRSTELIRC